MHNHIIRMHAQQHVRENGVVENAVKILGIDVAHRQRAGIAGHGEAVAFRDSHETTEERPFGEIVLR